MVYTVPTFDFGEALGQGLGAGIGGTMQQLTQNKMQEQQQQAKTAQLQKLLSGASLEDLRDPLKRNILLAAFPDLAKNLGQEFTEEKKISGRISQEQEKNKGKLSPQDLERTKIQIREQEKKLSDARSAIPKLKDNLSNLSHLRSMAEKLRGPAGVVKSALGSRVATEFNTIGFEQIEPILKIFNPVGAIPVQKVKIIQDKFAPKSGELYQTQIGKINALEHLVKQALKRNEDFIRLSKEYGGMIPQEVQDEFSEQSNQEIDKIVKEEGKKVESESKEKKESEMVTLRAPDGRKFRVAKNSDEHKKLKQLKAEEI